ncbi:MAG: hypothetical protein AAF078_03645 [Planctomycetota bacterium]
MSSSLPFFGMLLIALTMAAMVFTAPAMAESERTKIDAAMAALRDAYAQRPFRAHQFRTDSVEDTATSIDLLEPDGAFRDLRDQETKLRDDRSHQAPYSKPQLPVADVSVAAWNRIWRIAEDFRGKPEGHSPELRGRLLRAIARYAEWETTRPDGRFRFHESCFTVSIAGMRQK